MSLDEKIKDALVVGAGVLIHTGMTFSPTLKVGVSNPCARYARNKLVLLHRLYCNGYLDVFSISILQLGL